MKYDEFATYNRDIEKRDAIYALKRAYQRKNILRPVLEQFPHGTGMTMLEIGPGMGCLIDLMHERYPDIEYHALDIDAALLSKLKSEYPSLHTHHVEDAEGLRSIGLPTLDIVAAIDVWEHLPRSQVVDYTSTCIERLAEQGLFIAQVPNWGCPITPHAVYAGDLTHTIPYNELSAQQLLLMAGADANKIEIRGRMSPGVTGWIRDAVRTVLLQLYRTSFILMGTVRLRILEPDLIMLYRKGGRESTP